MGILSPEPETVKLFVAILTGQPELLPRTREELEVLFGPVDLASEVLAFDQTRYYETEMGSGLKRQFLGFQRLFPPGDLARAKTLTNWLEEDWARGTSGGRPVNLDPGYVEPSKVVLASTKNFYHRVYLKDGIYAEVTLRFRKGSFQHFPWTYPDYRGEAYQRFLLLLRKRYLEQRRLERASAVPTNSP
ncbi:MAG: DUF4416 family protein [Acidobacteria bacterium]|nr:DUF4416 family protein [Acidobacteriota bacterium]